MRILIVDDSRSIQKTVSWRIQKIGHEIVGVGSDGNEGLKLFKDLRPDITLLDITMPNMDGRECLKQILRENSAAKVVMLSAIGSPEVVSECMSVGAIAFIDKNKMMTEDYLEHQLSLIVAQLAARAA